MRRKEDVVAGLESGADDYLTKPFDPHGHLAGDEVLKETARRLVSSVGSYDYVDRFGGEEFLVTLNNCDAAFGLGRAEKIRSTIAVEASGGRCELR